MPQATPITPSSMTPQRWLRRIALAGMTFGMGTLESSEPALTAPALPPSEQAKTVYVGIERPLMVKTHYPDHQLDPQRSQEFLQLLRQMPGLQVRPLQHDGDARTLIYPKDPVIPLPDEHFRVPGETPGSAVADITNHGDAEAIRAQLMADGFTEIAPLGFNIDGGDIIYDAKRGIFLIGGTPDQASARADAFHQATGHYAIPIQMTQEYARHGSIPAGQGLVENTALFYHLDTFTNALPNGELMIYPEATDTTSMAQLQAIYGKQLIKIGAEDAHRYITNLISSRDPEGNAYLFLPAVSHHTPFDDETPLRAQLTARGYHVVSPETLGYREPHRYSLDLFDTKTDFPTRLLAVLTQWEMPAIPDMQTLEAMAGDQGLDIATDAGRLIFRQISTPTRYWACSGAPGAILTGAEQQEAETAIHAFTLHHQLRAGTIDEEMLVANLAPELEQSLCESMAAQRAYRFLSAGSAEEITSPFIQNKGGIDCMTLDVLHSPSPQQQVFTLLTGPQNRTTLRQAQLIAQKAGWNFEIAGKALHISYADGMRQSFDLNGKFTDNQISTAPAKAIAHDR